MCATTLPWYEYVHLSQHDCNVWYAATLTILFGRYIRIVYTYFIDYACESGCDSTADDSTYVDLSLRYAPLVCVTT